MANIRELPGGDQVHQSHYNSVIREVNRLSRIRVAPPLELISNQAGVLIRLAPTPIIFDEITLGMIANWEFQTTGDVRDETANGFDLTASGSPTSVPGVIGNAAHLDGSTGFYSLHPYPIFSLDNGDRTVRVRFRLDAAPGTGQHQVIIGKTSAISSDLASEWAISVKEESGDIRLRLANATNSIYIDGGTALSTDTWYDVTVVLDFDNNLVTYYLNDTVGTSSSWWAASPPAFDALRWVGVGAYSVGHSGGNFLDGRIDIAQIWNRQLAAVERSWLYNRGIGRDPDNDTLEYPYDDPKADAKTSGRQDWGMLSAPTDDRPSVITKLSYSVDGDERGTMAFDGQISRNASDQVASGFASVVFGHQNKVAGNYSAAMGRDNDVAGGFAFGSNNIHPATAANSLSTGLRASPDRQNEFVQASGNFASEGDAQGSHVVLFNDTVGAANAVLFNNSSHEFEIEEDSTVLLDVLVVARRTDADNESAAYHARFCVDRNTGGAAAFVGAAPTFTVVAEDTAAWNIAVSTPSGGRVRFTATGQSGKTIYWVAYIRSVKVRG